MMKKKSWMSKGVHDVLALVIIYLGYDWKPKHVTLSLLDAFKTT